MRDSDRPIPTKRSQHRIILSPLGEKILKDGFERNLTYKEIAASLHKATGVVMCGSTVRKRRLEWYVQKAREETRWLLSKQELLGTLTWKVDEVAEFLMKVDISENSGIRRLSQLTWAFRSYLKTPTAEALRALGELALLYLVEDQAHRLVVAKGEA